MLVKATEMSSKLGVRIKELGRIASRGETFDVTQLRFKVLSGDNRYKAVFVTKVENKKQNEIDAVELYKKEVEDKPVEEPKTEEVVEEVKEAVAETPAEEDAPKKRGRKKKK